MNVSTRVLIRRLDVLGLLGEGRTQREVATIIGISVRQVQRVVQLHRLGVAVPADQLPDAIGAALEHEKNARRRAVLLHDQAGLVIEEAKVLRRERRAGRRRRRDREHDALDSVGTRPAAVDRSPPALDEAPERVDAIRRAAAWGLALVRSSDSPTLRT